MMGVFILQMFGIRKILFVFMLFLVVIGQFQVLSVKAQTSDNLEMTVYPSDQFVSRGETAVFNVTLKRSSFFAQFLVDVFDVPSGLSYDIFGPRVIEHMINSTTTLYILRITAGDDSSLGYNIISVKGSSGEMVKSTTISLNVEPRPESSISSAIRAIFLRTNFFNDDSKNFEIVIGGTGERRISEVTISDQNKNIIYKTFASGDSRVVTPSLKIEKGKPYFITTESVSNERLVHMIYCTDHIIECFPIRYWVGDDGLNDYEEYLNIFERAYNILISLTRNGRDVGGRGVTINRVPWSAAHGGYSGFTYGIFDSIRYSNVDDLAIMFHELTHAVLVGTYGLDLLTVEGIACFFQAELFPIYRRPRILLRSRSWSLSPGRPSWPLTS